MLQKNSNTQSNPKIAQQEAKTIRSIKSKLHSYNTTITHADKENSIVILPTQQYNPKLQEFILQNHTHNPTKTLQSQVRKTLNNSKILIPQDSRWKYTNMNPSATTIKGLIKVHKPGQPIRPVVNWRNAPAYHLARSFTQKTRQIAPLPNTYNIENTRELIHTLKHTPISPHYKLAYIVIANLYTNITVKETSDILFAKLEQNGTDSKVIQELMSWYDTITSQNYFTHSENIQIQKDGLTMGAPSSGLISELFLQQMEHLHLTHLQTKLRIVDYFRYVDDILLFFDSDHTDIQSVLSEFNAIHQNLKFTAETETDNKINYLDITIHRTPTDWKISIYRKPTFTDTIIPYTSDHRTQHKFAAIRFL
jgi:hypothetical protein